MDRGICATIYARARRGVNRQELENLYRDFYRDEPFVRVRSEPPKTKDVIHTNYCDLHAEAVGDQVVVFSVLDNLVKGAAGQAVQNLNLICDLPETMGLL